MGRDYQAETVRRVDYIKQLLQQSGAQGIVFGNSGGKDSALCGILCRMATENVLGVCMPCQSKRNFGEDLADGLALASQFGIRNVTVDLTAVKETLLKELASLDLTALDKGQANLYNVNKTFEVSKAASSNIAPRLRMTALYAVAQTMNYLVCGTGNASEYFMGYFTKWGDGGFDFNPIADLTVSEVYAFLAHLGAPEGIRSKAPSAGLYEGQTDEGDMGVTYAQIERYLNEGASGDPDADAIIARYHRVSHHKRMPPNRYGG